MAKSKPSFSAAEGLFTSSRKENTYDVSTDTSIIPKVPEMEETENAIASTSTRDMPASPSVKKERGRKPIQQERKSRITLTLYPSDYKDIQKIAYVERKSVSEIMTELILEYKKTHHSQLEQYDDIRK